VQAFSLLPAGRDSSLQVLVDEEIRLDVVGHAIVRVVQAAVAVGVLEHLPVLHLVAFAVAVVPDRVAELDLVLVGQEFRPFGRSRRPDDLRLDAVIGRGDAALGDIETRAVHAQLVVDEEVVGILRTAERHPPPAGAGCFFRTSERNGGFLSYSGFLPWGSPPAIKMRPASSMRKNAKECAPPFFIDVPPFRPLPEKSPTNYVWEARGDVSTRRQLVWGRASARSFSSGGGSARKFR
jgi:hypothetical protein